MMYVEDKIVFKAQVEKTTKCRSVTYEVMLVIDYYTYKYKISTIIIIVQMYMIKSIQFHHTLMA